MNWKPTPQSDGEADNKAEVYTLLNPFSFPWAMTLKVSRLSYKLFFFPRLQLIESRTLTIARNLTQQLQTTCLTLVSNLQGLPQNIQEQTLSIGHMAMDVYTRFNNAAALSDLSDNVLTNTRGQLKRIRDSIDNVMDHLVNNTPLNWLVGPFYPRTELAIKPRSQSSEESNVQPEVEMQPLDQ